MSLRRLTVVRLVARLSSGLGVALYRCAWLSAVSSLPLLCEGFDAKLVSLGENVAQLGDELRARRWRGCAVQLMVPRSPDDLLYGTIEGYLVTQCSIDESCFVLRVLVTRRDIAVCEQSDQLLISRALFRALDRYAARTVWDCREQTARIEINYYEEAKKVARVIVGWDFKIPSHHRLHRCLLRMMGMWTSPEIR